MFLLQTGSDRRTVTERGAFLSSPEVRVVEVTSPTHSRLVVRTMSEDDAHVPERGSPGRACWRARSHVISTGTA